jgi:hypothetical protein
METSAETGLRIYEIEKSKSTLKRLVTLIERPEYARYNCIIPGTYGQMRHQIEDRIAEIKLKLFLLGVSTDDQ